MPPSPPTGYWKKYKLGDRRKITDPATKQPAVRNIYLSDGDVSIKALQERGTIFWQCDVALGGIVQELAQATGMPAAEVRAELIAGFVPGVRLVPSHVLAIGLTQPAGRVSRLHVREASLLHQSKRSENCDLEILIATMRSRRVSRAL